MYKNYNLVKEQELKDINSYGELLSHEKSGARVLLIKNSDENPTVGILRSTLKNKTVVKYTLPEDNKNICSSSYKLHLPTEQELIKVVEEEKKNFELNQIIDNLKI